MPSKMFMSFFLQWKRNLVEENRNFLHTMDFNVDQIVEVQINAVQRAMENFTGLCTIPAEE